MKVLIIGGTQFLGRHLVNAARARGHELTLFHRGRTNPDLFPYVAKIIGDREKDLGRLAGKSWDVVIDTCGYIPRLVRQSALALRDAVRSYVFISSLSVYADFSRIGINESAPLGRLGDESREEITRESYGPLKALCERAVQEVFGVRSVILRSGLIVGPHDPTDRFTYWPLRVARGGEVLAPDHPKAPIQVIDVRDLVDFILELIQQNSSGVFNATGPAQELTMGRLLETCKKMSRSDAHFRWAPLSFLEEHKVQAWTDLPAWMPDQGDYTGFARVDITKAMQAGLSFCPLEYTIRDTLEWAAGLPADHIWQAGLKPERERELLGMLKNPAR
jgi:2'-hydroxyisoflavone reductase